MRERKQSGLTIGPRSGRPRPELRDWSNESAGSLSRKMREKSPAIRSHRMKIRPNADTAEFD